jgi:hypothetical protein
MQQYYKTVHIRVGSPTVIREKETGFFGNRIEEKEELAWKHCDIDKLSISIEKETNKLYEAGYKVISILPILRGDLHFYSDAGGGFSITEGVIITAELIDG